MIAYYHALRVPELVNLKWSQVDLTQGLVHVNRLMNGVASVHKMVKRVGEKAGLPLPIHPHMLRHSTGFKLANDK